MWFGSWASAISLLIQPVYHDSLFSPCVSRCHSSLRHHVCPRLTCSSRLPVHAVSKPPPYLVTDTISASPFVSGRSSRPLSRIKSSPPCVSSIAAVSTPSRCAFTDRLLYLGRSSSLYFSASYPILFHPGGGVTSQLTSPRHEDCLLLVNC